MELGTRSLVGRSRELASLTTALSAAQSGRGSVWLITGEPGIGKSRFVEEVARLSAERELSVLWGRAWEAGGAPAYWLFIQVLRALFRAEDARELLDAPAAAALIELLPELRELAGAPDRASSPQALEPEQAHFRLMDAATRVLAAASRRAPLLVILEDLHAADPASVAMLGLLAQQATDGALVVVGTYRESDAQRSPCAEALGRISQRAERIVLDRLSQEEVRDLLGRALSSPVDDALCSAVHAATEGNPLFVGEVARLHAQQRLAPRSAQGVPPLAIPASIRSAIRSRLAALSPRARQLLGLAAVIGREHRSEALQQLAGRSPRDTLEILDECISAEILLEVAPGILRFSHILLREVAYADLDRLEREAAHEAFAKLLESQLGERALSERAHHLLNASPSAARAALDASRRAAQEACKQHACVEAASWYEKVVSVLDRVVHEPAERCVALLDLGEAQLIAHAFDAGHKSCSEAAAIARNLGDAELFARAALAQGIVFRVAEVSQPLVAALREALELLPDDISPLRAKVLARLAAALQPAEDPRPPVELAKQAIAMARQIGDPQTLLEVIRAGCSAMIDLCPVADCLPLCREHIALAEQQGNATERFRGNMRLAIVAYEAGEVREALAAITACEQLARDIPHPLFGWRTASMVAMRAMWQGRFDEAHAALERAGTLAEQAADPSGALAIGLQRTTLLQLQGRFDEARSALAVNERIAPTSWIIVVSITMWIAGVLIRIGRKQEAVARVRDKCGDLQYAMLDLTLHGALVDVSIAQGDRELMSMLKAHALEHAHESVSGGLFGMTWDMPVRRGLAELCAALGEWSESKLHYDLLFSELRKRGARAHLAWALLDHGRACSVHGEDERAALLLEEARALGAELGIRADAFALERAVARSGAPPASEPAPSLPAPAATLLDFRLTREGEYWSIERSGRSFRLKDGKGLAMLARLVEEPGRELHVLDLASGAGAGGAIDGGDAGALLDPKARAAYEGRVRELREELEEAERHADRARSARLSEELDALSQELARAVGLGGRDRRAASAVERARVNVQRRLRDAVDRIREHDPDLGRHLAFTLKTGTYCSYLR
jgi:tetratricopeptide (TPR) repeat protein